MIQWIKDLFKSKGEDNNHLPPLPYTYPQLKEMIDKNEHPEWNRYDETNACVWYEDNDGNIYRDKEEYLRENRDKKLNDLLNSKKS